ncbi:MAG TPA: fatty acid desaturase [bacterium]|jgi:fatty acid desaturase
MHDTIVRNNQIKLTDSELKRKIRESIPKSAHKRLEWKILLLIPFVLSIIGMSILIINLESWLLMIPASIVLGLIYSSFALFGHEIGHGAVVKSKTIQHFSLYLTFLIFFLSPTLWFVWHNGVHHGNTNIDDADPDIPGFLHKFENILIMRTIQRLFPGTRHWLCIFYLPTFFTLHGQAILWHRSKHPLFNRLNRTVAFTEMFIMLGFWIALGIAVGFVNSIFMIIIPMMISNAIAMSYIATNHQLRSLSEERVDILDNTMSVSTFKVLDIIHFNFSHHVEHHLFPSMNSRYLPRVRKSIIDLEPDRYLAPTHWLAMKYLATTPRLYLDGEHLTDMEGRRKVNIREIEHTLLHSTKKIYQT